MLPTVLRIRIDSSGFVLILWILILPFHQCCGPESVGSVCFWVFLRIRIHKYEGLIRLRFLLSTNKNTKIVRKYLDSYRFVTSFWRFIFEKWCKCNFKNKQKTLEKQKKFLAILKVTNENSRIRSRIRILLSKVRIWIRIRTKISWIRNTAFHDGIKNCIPEPQH